MLSETFDNLRIALNEEVRYQRAKAALKTLALCQRVMCYSQVGPIAGFHHRDAKFWGVLGRIMEDDHKEGFPLTSSCVIGKVTGVPGPAYFAKALSLGYVFDRGEAGERAFWVDQLVKIGINLNGVSA